MYAAVARDLANIAGPVGTLLVLDDLHWAESDATVISRLKHSLGVVDDSLWQHLPNLAPGQVLVAMSLLPLVVIGDQPTGHQ